MELWWNDTDRGKTEVLGETPAQVTLCPSQIIANGRVSNPGFHSDSPLYYEIK
jgi:hypothetical protein